MIKIDKKDIGYNPRKDELGTFEFYNDPVRIYVKYSSAFFVSMAPLFKKDLKFIFEMNDGTKIWYV